MELRFWLKAVSYTHLDVYKRQDVDSLNAQEGYRGTSYESVFLLSASEDVYKRQLVKKNNPGWKPGDAFDTSILDQTSPYPIQTLSFSNPYH